MRISLKAHPSFKITRVLDVTYLTPLVMATPVANKFPKPATIIFRVLLFAAIILIFFGSLSMGGTVKSINNADKVVHLVAYAGLAWLAIPSFSNTSIWKVFLILVCFGVGIEIAQSLMDFGRQGSLLDIYANAVGVSLGVLFWLIIASLWNKKKRI